jgi:hypothetical protein
MNPAWCNNQTMKFNLSLFKPKIEMIALPFLPSFSTSPKQSTQFRCLAVSKSEKACGYWEVPVLLHFPTLPLVPLLVTLYPDVIRFVAKPCGHNVAYCGEISLRSEELDIDFVSYLRTALKLNSSASRVRKWLLKFFSTPKTLSYIIN